MKNTIIGFLVNLLANMFGKFEEKTFFVEITNVSNDALWYSELIGDVFECSDVNDEEYYFTNNGGIFFINKEDAEVINV